MRRLVREAAEDDARDGLALARAAGRPDVVRRASRRPHADLELIQDAARNASAATGVGISLIVAASRMRHPLDARTLARLAAQHAGDGRRGRRLRPEQRRAPRVTRGVRRRLPDRAAGRAGVACRTAASCSARDNVRTTLDTLAPDRIGHGVAVGRGPGGARRRGRREDHAGGLPRQQRRPRGLRRAGRRAAARPAATPAPGSRSAPTTRCCSARGWPTSTASPARSTAATTPSWPTWPAARCAARGRPAGVRRPAPRRHRRLAGCLTGATATANVSLH